MATRNVLNDRTDWTNMENRSWWSVDDFIAEMIPSFLSVDEEENQTTETRLLH